MMARQVITKEENKWFFNNEINLTRTDHQPREGALVHR